MTWSPLYCMNHHKHLVSLLPLLNWYYFFLYFKTNSIHYKRFKENYSDWLDKNDKVTAGSDGVGVGVGVKAEKSALYVSESKDHPTYKLLTAGKIQVHSISKIYKVLSYNVFWRYRRSLHLGAEMPHSGDVQYAGRAAPCEWKVFFLMIVFFSHIYLCFILFSFLTTYKQVKETRANSEICKDEMKEIRQNTSPSLLSVCDC